MSRVTPPVTKFQQTLRGISSSAKVRHPAGLMNSAARQKARSSRNTKELQGESTMTTTSSNKELGDRLAAFDLTRSHSTFGGHRPLPTQLGPVCKIIPLMQGFQTSAPKQATHDNSSLDFMFFPEISETLPSNSFSSLRVPLLPDNYTPDRSASSVHAMESLHDAVPRPEISVVAAHPENVTAAALTEIVGNAGLDTPLESLTAGFSSTHASAVEVSREPGQIKELWNDFIEDIFGPKNNPKVAL